MSISIWLRRSGDSPNTPPVLITHEDTLTRCLAEGWTEVEMPAEPASTPAASESLPDTPDTPAPAEAVSAPPQRAKRTSAKVTKVKEG